MWLAMPDGVRLSATLTIPIPKYDNEKFPVLLEYKPYRKDDSFYNFNQPNIYYLARRGFIVAKVDIRELDDCERVIELLANHSRSNGGVGMYGLSWSAFNSLMMATLRRPPALRAIFVAHGSEDLYNNDVHYGDGILHEDEYMLSIDHENALPASPNYVMDEEWIKQRFTARPWIDVYLEHQADDSFWRKNSIKYAYENLTVPVYLIAGFYDAYKDFAINIYENAHQVSPKIKVVIGPFVHAMPEYSNRNPGPSFDGKAEMVRWFNHWLRDENEKNDLINEPDITLFIRTSLTTGTYRYESQWPIGRQRIHRMFMGKGQKLVKQSTTTTEEEAKENDNHVDTLEYRPWIGYEAGAWLGGLTGDQRPFDKDCLIYESDLIVDKIEIAGFVKVSLQKRMALVKILQMIITVLNQRIGVKTRMLLYLQVSATSRMAHWFVRLEDVDIDGQVWLITTGAMNGARRQMPPAYLEPNHVYTITFQLHFTTRTFLPGHRIRIAVSNAMFYSNWPTPFAMNTSIYLNSSATFIDLPVILPMTSLSPHPLVPTFTQQQVSPMDILPMPFSGGKPRIYRKDETDLSTSIIFEQLTYELLPNGCFISAFLTWNFTCSHLDPANVRWTTRARQIYVFDMYGYASIDDIPMKADDEQVYPNVDLSTRRYFELATDLRMYSDQDDFYVNLKRQLWNSNQTMSEPFVTFVFNGKHKRQFH
ncbi:unnamed protein product [Adineta steineri]|uniref:Xaa-Pro dipeptidyl-peptidase C-terminal domain-containing protein n=1 Tax=Adineta steineri TaxID=433720 RepID=A0A814V423_9BILA|nr:unnamed protein product [Adineta steineri]CAF1414771.1 unnamed protein product [Adineta steineri]